MLQIQANTELQTKTLCYLEDSDIPQKDSDKNETPDQIFESSPSYTSLAMEKYYQNQIAASQFLPFPEPQRGSQDVLTKLASQLSDLIEHLKNENLELKKNIREINEDKLHLENLVTNAIKEVTYSLEGRFEEIYKKMSEDLKNLIRGHDISHLTLEELLNKLKVLQKEEDKIYEGWHELSVLPTSDFSKMENRGEWEIVEIEDNRYYALTHLEIDKDPKTQSEIEKLIIELETVTKLAESHKKMQFELPADRDRMLEALSVILKVISLTGSGTKLTFWTIAFLYKESVRIATLFGVACVVIQSPWTPLTNMIASFAFSVLKKVLLK